MMQHRNMFNYQRFSILIGTNKFLTKNSFSMYKCKPLFFSFLLILFVQPFFIQILYISKRLVSGFSRLASSYSLASLNMKNFTLATPLNWLRKALIVALNDSAEAFVNRSSK